MRITSIILIGVITLLLSCNENSLSRSKSATSYADSVKIDYMADSMAKKAIKDAQKDRVVSDASLAESAPVKVLKHRFVSHSEYSNYRDVELTFKNISNKTVVAIRFKWYGENVFNEPADMGAYEGIGGGFTESKLKPGKVSTSQWEILSRDGKKIVFAYPYEVMFEDGTKWELSSK